MLYIHTYILYNVVYIYIYIYIYMYIYIYIYIYVILNEKGEAYKLNTCNIRPDGTHIHGTYSHGTDPQGIFVLGIHPRGTYVTDPHVLVKQRDHVARGSNNS